MSRFLREASKVGIIHNQCGEIGDGGHDGVHHSPSEFGSVDGARLNDDGANAMGSHNSPNAERNASNGSRVGLDGEEMPNLVNREPDGWQRQ